MGTFSTLQDSIRDNQTAAVTSNSALKVQPQYNSTLIGSATATGTIFGGPGVLHSVVMGASAAGSILALFDGATAAAIGSDLAITELQLGTQQPTRLYDVIFSTGLTYRLSAVACPGVVVTYAKGV